jgi:hypothetical protein
MNRTIEPGQRWLKADLSGKGVFVIAVEQWLDITVVIYHTDDHKMKARDEQSFRSKYAPKMPVGYAEFGPDDVALMCDGVSPFSMETF